MDVKGKGLKRRVVVSIFVVGRNVFITVLNAVFSLKLIICFFQEEVNDRFISL
jgi:hypothetical protein